MDKYKPINRVGQRFGKLLVTSQGVRLATGEYTCDCICDCGNIITVDTVRLVTGKITSCGCCKEESYVKHRDRQSRNLVGMTFGDLTVVEEIEPKIYENGKKIRMFHTICKCGNTRDVTYTGLVRQKISQCEKCKKKETRRPLRKSYNGKRFGLLTVIEDTIIKTDEKGKNTRYCKCLCDCGNIRITAASTLGTGLVWNCGRYCQRTNKDSKNKKHLAG